MLTRTYPLVVQLYKRPHSMSNSTNLTTRSPTRMIHLATNLPARNTLKCEHGTYEPPRLYPHTRVSLI